MSKKIFDSEKESVLERTFMLDRKTIRETESGSRTVDAALSSETPVKRFFGTEILDHTSEAINMERAGAGLPLLWSHNDQEIIGRAENIRLDEDKVLRGTLRFSKNAKAEEVWRDIEDEVLRDVSIRYRIDGWKEEADDVVRVTEWVPLEASIVTVPADHRVGLNRNIAQESAEMTDETSNEPAADEQATRQENVVDIEKFLADGQKREHERIKGINALVDRYERRFGDDTFSQIRTDALEDIRCDADFVRNLLDEAILEGHVPVNVATSQDEGSSFRGATAGEDQLDKFTRGAELVFQVRSDCQVDGEKRREMFSGEFAGMSTAELAREYLRINGQRPTGRRDQIVGQALVYGQRDGGMGHGTGHFANILENVANKSLLEGFEQAEETYAAWTQTRTLTDFKPASLYNLSLFDDLELVREGAQYTHGTMDDIKEQIQLSTYGRLFSITRQALANDDLSALGEIPRAMGAAAAYKVGDVVYAVLTTGTSTTMLQDGVALFDASTHGNYVTSGAAPSVATLNAAKVAMATQTDPKGKVLGKRGRYLLVPINLETTSQTLIAATYDPAGTAGTLTPNPFQNTMQVVSDHRLDTFNSSGWFIAAATNTVAVGYLNGQTTPFMDSKAGWSIDGVEYKVRQDIAATATDFRGLYYNDGVT